MALDPHEQSLTTDAAADAITPPNAQVPVVSDDDAPPVWVARIGLTTGLLLAAIVLCLPTPTGLNPAAQRLAAVTVLMAACWVTQAIPTAVTSLFPLVLFPLAGIASADRVSRLYLNDISFLYLGGFLLALAIERWHLHRRIALRVVSLVGCSPRRIILGFLLATFLISMWISNTATTLMMLPIAMALLQSLEDLFRNQSNPSASTSITHDQQQALLTVRELGTSLMIGIAYAAGIGGLTTLVGTPTNMAFVNLWKKYEPTSTISAGQWMLTWVPFGIVFLLGCWVLLSWRLSAPPGFASFDRRFFHRRLAELGPPSGGERWVFAVFIVTALLWVFRTDLRITADWSLPGWSPYAERWLKSLGVTDTTETTKLKDWISDATVGMAMALLMFLIPARDPQRGQLVPLLDWTTAKKVPWEILLLFGGGFAIADGFQATKLSEWTGGILAEWARPQPLWLQITAVCVLLTFLTEFTSNVATINTLIPVLYPVAVTLGVSPLLFLVPATISASCAFMLPVGTPPNAIVCGTGRVPLARMAAVGFWMNCLGVLLTVLATYWLMIPQWGLAQ